MRHKQIGFTLIELLVVVAVIALLLALLMPALDQAIYQAELTTCGVRTRSLASAATFYATDNKRRYPDRETWRGGKYKTNRPNKLWSASGSKNHMDARPFVRPYLASIDKNFQCPLLPEMHIDVNDVDTRPAGEAGWTSYQFWYGWQYAAALDGVNAPGAGNVGGTPTPNEKGMLRLGDRFAYQGKTFDVIANDYDLVSAPGTQPGFDNTSIGSHFDKAPRQVMSISIANNEPTVDAFPEAGRNNFIWSRWQGPYLRGTIDMNFAHTDNSVNRLVDVVLERDPVDHTPDERITRVPEGSSDEWPGWRDSLPATGG